MRRFRTTILIMAVFVLSAFGLLMVAHENGHSNCFASAMSGEACPLNPLADVNFHVNTFNNLSVGIARGAIAAVSAVILAFALFGIVHIIKPQLARTLSFVRHKNDSWLPRSHAISPLISWFVEKRSDISARIA